MGNGLLERIFVMSYRGVSVENVAIMRRDMSRAMHGALAAHFLGEGALRRTVVFGWRVLLSAGAATGALMALWSWALVGGLVAGPDHEQLLAAFRAWMVSLSPERLQAVAHLYFVDALTFSAQFGAAIALLLRLHAIVAPAVAAAREPYLRR